MPSRASCLGRVIVVLQAFLVSASVTSSGWGEDGGLRFEAIGSTVNLSCSRDGSSSVVQWWFNGAPLLPLHSLIHHGHLVLYKVDRSAEGNYSCHNKTGRLLSTVFLRLGHPPGMPSVFCRVSDYENISCFWNSSRETFLPTRYFATYRKHTLTEEEKLGNSHYVAGTCLQDPSRPYMCSLRHSEFWSLYTMNITEENPLGSRFRLLNVIMHAIVKPDPPEGLVVEPIPYFPRRLRVSWDYPTTWPKSAHFKLKFRMQYRPVVHHVWSVVEIDNLTDVIMDAILGMEHVVQVSAKDYMDAGNWSDWTAEVRATPWITPSEKIPTTDPEIITEETSKEPVPVVFDTSDQLEKVTVLACLGVFAFVILVVVLVVIVLIWFRLRRRVKDGTKKHDFISAIHMKALPMIQVSKNATPSSPIS